MNPSPSPNAAPTSLLEGWASPALNRLRAGRRNMVFSGLWGSSKAALTAALAQEMGPSFLILTENNARAESFHQDLCFWLGLLGGPADPPLLFPSPETLPYEMTPPHPDLVRRRIGTLFQLARADEKRPRLVVASVQAVMQKVMAPADLLETARFLSAGSETDRDLLLEAVVEMGYTSVQRVEYPGEFCVRGGILDLFSPSEEEPVRIDWAGDRIESIRFFQTESQISSAPKADIWILPAFEPRDRAPATLLDYLPREGWRVLDEAARLEEAEEEFETEVGLAADSAGAAGKGSRLYLTPEELRRRLHTGPWIGLETLHREAEAGSDRQPFETRSPETLGLGVKGSSLSGSLKILDDLRKKARVLFIVKTAVQRERLMELFREHDLPAAPWSETAGLAEGPGTPVPFAVETGEMSSGFVDLGHRLAVFTDEDLFGKAAKHRTPPRARRTAFLASLEDLEEGDYVVHAQHGIGRYEGLKRLSVQGYESDFLILRYLGGDTLYLPVDRLALVQKYSGVEGHRPKMDRLGGSTWAKTTQRVKKAVETMAREIVELYAARELTPGHPFSKESSLSREFEAAFPFEETPDQHRTIEEVRRDMERSRPMDRLVCGDVGYGKTEVAMRAAFKAVLDGKQVAVLVPTTLLAHQHGENFRERFAPFPVRVETLSRFRSPKEQKEVLAGLGEGKVDIVIGTHRLLQKDVSFRDLGLLVVDEEQRFGVAHKERIKQLRTSVDTLTLTATPIPRTLQMAMTGIRELSIIETPPADRLGVRTILTRFERPVIRNAILRELARGGQVFFVHNRVQDIERVAGLLREIVPEAKIGVAHGQMNERVLEQEMRRFVHQETQVLLSTAIIESGLDIPSANTIIIDDAHRFGLADLYQLRGRVGRSGHQAYAYLLVPSERGLTEEARARIEAIQEFCELGSGFRIAARDLEIRGCGNFLGLQQSGHIAAVGLDYYLQLIEKTVEEFRGKPADVEVEPALNLKVSAYIPEDYIQDVAQRLSVYQRLSSLHSEEEADLFRAEMEDRFGPSPSPFIRLLEVVTVKLLCRALRIQRLETTGTGVRLEFDPNRPLPEALAARLLADSSRKPPASREESFTLTIASEYSLALSIRDPAQGEWAALYPLLKNYLKSLLLYVK